MNPNEQNAQPPQKLIDFNEELKALCDKYQYELRAALQSDPFRGIFPTLQVVDASPKDKGVPLNTASPEEKTDTVAEPSPTPAVN